MSRKEKKNIYTSGEESVLSAIEYDNAAKRASISRRGYISPTPLSLGSYKERKEMLFAFIQSRR